ncbi:MAG: methylmalonyl-CoA epimerase [Candidatus Krumholzibacteria bacterium]|nr:methylmalonyl-CoA epimerase [Candidatus Krumholzibacteria bacterium]
MQSRLETLDHIGIAVRNLEDAKKMFSDTLGLVLIREQELPERGLKIAFLSAGSTTVELLEGIEPDSSVAKFVEQRGPGIHHLCFEVDGIDRVMRELTDSGVRFVDATPRLGSEGKPIAFIHPKSTLGVLIELIEK